MSRRLEPLNPVKPGQIDMFVCGPTVYDYSHLGHAKTYTQFDFIARYLRFRGYKVRYVQNITDIDDKIIKRAQVENISPKDLAAQYEQYYKEDMVALHNTSVDTYARAHDHIPDVISQIEALISKGFAYKTSDGYYYNIKKFHDYGKLSGRTHIEEGDAVSRVDENAEKKNTGDFCLWKFKKPGEPSWESPLGEGRPGWHIEDTAITEHYFGPQYDLHGGAIDLIFPHHEAEIAQMEAASGQAPLVRHWLHTGFLNIQKPSTDNPATPEPSKMGKSLGNATSIRQMLQTINYTVLRYFFISHHYRQSIELTDEAVSSARNSLERIHIFTRQIDPNLDDQDNDSFVRATRAQLIAHLDNDFDTPKALATLFEFIRDQNKRGPSGRRVFDLIQEINTITDMLPLEPLILDDEIQASIAKRDLLRSQKKYAEADVIRDQLAAAGIILEDTGSDVKHRRRL